MATGQGEAEDFSVGIFLVLVTISTASLARIIALTDSQTVTELAFPRTHGESPSTDRETILDGSNRDSAREGASPPRIEIEYDRLADISTH